MWKEIAKELGVELEERFDIIYNNKKTIKENVYIDNFGICVEKKGEVDDFLDGRHVCNLLNRNSNYSIRKRPFIPKENQVFYYIQEYDIVYNDSICITDSIWKDTVIQRCLLKCGNVFKTEQDARNNANTLYEKCKYLSIESQ